MGEFLESARETATAAVGNLTPETWALEHTTPVPRAEATPSAQIRAALAVAMGIVHDEAVVLHITRAGKKNVPNSRRVRVIAYAHPA